MSHHDDELDALLKPLREAGPSAAQLHSWKAAVGNRAGENVFRISRSRMWVQMAAAMLIGILIGGGLMQAMGKKSSGFEMVAENHSSNATFEYSHANLD